jgi:alpha-acetolactate decarboxylase
MPEENYMNSFVSAAGNHRHRLRDSRQFAIVLIHTTVSEAVCEIQHENRRLCYITD